MQDRLRDLIDLRNAIADATDRAFDDVLPEVAHKLLAIELDVARLIVQTSATDTAAKN